MGGHRDRMDDHGIVERFYFILFALYCFIRSLLFYSRSTVLFALCCFIRSLPFYSLFFVRSLSFALFYALFLFALFFSRSFIGIEGRGKKGKKRKKEIHLCTGSEGQVKCPWSGEWQIAVKWPASAGQMAVCPWLPWLFAGAVYAHTHVHHHHHRHHRARRCCRVQRGWMDWKAGKSRST